MRCEEIQERFVELLYRESGTPPASPELQAHVLSCPVCQGRLQELQSVQKMLRLWPEEPMERPVTVPREAHRFGRAPAAYRRIAGFAAAAAAIVLAFLALSNAQMRWNQDGFSFQTRLWGGGESDVYSKEEVHELLLRAMRDSEQEIRESNFVMLQRMLETIDAERYQDLQRIELRLAKGLNRN